MPLNLAFGPVSFDTSLDDALNFNLVRALARAAAPPSALLYDPWPRTTQQSLVVEVGPCKSVEGGARYEEHAGTLRFRARGADARADGPRWRLRLDPSLRPGEMTDQLVLTLAAAGVAAILQEDLGVVFHASTSAQCGRAWTFPAPHATGKSTVVDRLDPDLKIADDLSTLVTDPAVGWCGGGVNATAAGTLPLGALLFLRRGARTELGPILPAAEAMRLSIRNAVLFPGSPTLSQRLMDRLADLVQEIPCRIMDFSLTDLDPTLFRRLACQTT